MTFCIIYKPFQHCVCEVSVVYNKVGNDFLYDLSINHSNTVCVKYLWFIIKWTMTFCMIYKPFQHCVCQVSVVYNKVGNDFLYDL